MPPPHSSIILRTDPSAIRATLALEFARFAANMRSTSCVVDASTSPSKSADSAAVVANVHALIAHVLREVDSDVLLDMAAAAILPCSSDDEDDAAYGMTKTVCLFLHFSIEN